MGKVLVFNIPPGQYQYKLWHGLLPRIFKFDGKWRYQKADQCVEHEMKQHLNYRAAMFIRRLNRGK